MTRTSLHARIPWPDAAKGWGIALVFFGHFIEPLAGASAPLAAAVFKFIYAYHMPLFFVLAGFTATLGSAARSEGMPAGAYFRRRFALRVTPFLAFNALILPAWLIRDVVQGTLAQTGYLNRASWLLQGHVAFNVPTWFLVCLFTVDLLHYLFRPWVRTLPRMLLGAAVFLGVGLPVTQNIFAVARMTGIGADFWYVHEALVGYGLFLVGMAAGTFRPSIDPSATQSRPARLAGLAALTLIAWFAAGLNNGPFIFTKPIVHMASSSHGNGVWFAAAALAGTFAVILLARLTAGWRPLLFLGRYSLAYIGFAGLFLQFVDTPLANWVQGNLPASPITTLGTSLAVTVLSLLICVPFAAPVDALLARLSGRGSGFSRSGATQTAEAVTTSAGTAASQ